MPRTLAVLNARISRVRRDTLNGRDFLVVPFVSLVPGVLNGSQGGLYYPPDTVAADVGMFNNTPLTAGHPKDPDTGRAVSAREPRVLERYQLGHVFNDRVTDKGARAGEAWFDVTMTKAKAPGVYNRLVAAFHGKAVPAIEVSTGIYTDSIPAVNGAVDDKNRPYHALVVAMRSDHLAVLEHERGACDVSTDGCGIGVANATAPSAAANCECRDEEDEVENDETAPDAALVPAGTGMAGDPISVGPTAPPTANQPRIIVPSRAPIYGHYDAREAWRVERAVANAAAEDDILPIPPVMNVGPRAFQEADWRDGGGTSRGRYGDGGHSFDDTGGGVLRPGTARRIIDVDDERLISPPLIEDRRVNGAPRSDADLRSGVLAPPPLDPRRFDPEERSEEMIDENLRRLGLREPGAGILNAADDLLIPLPCLPRARR